MSTRANQSFPVTAPTKDFPQDNRSAADQSAGDISIGSSEVVYEERLGVKNLAERFSGEAVKQERVNFWTF